MKNNVYPFKPQFYYIKVGFKGVKIILVCFCDAPDSKPRPCDPESLGPEKSIHLDAFYTTHTAVKLDGIYCTVNMEVFFDYS